MTLLTEPESNEASNGEAARAPQRVERDLTCMLLDGGMFSLMVGIGETYLPAFVLAVSQNEIAAGLVTTLPMFAGAVLQLLAPRLMRLLGTHCRWVIFCAAMQALSWLPLMVGAFCGSLPVWTIFVCAAWYWCTGLATNAAWNIWADKLVPLPNRARYFARRTRIVQAGTLLGFVAGGAFLQYSNHWGHPVWVFGVLFFVAFSARAISSLLLSMQSEPLDLRGIQPRLPLREAWSRVTRGEEGRLLLYLWLMQGAAQISGPYFTPFMLERMEFDYVTYVLLMGASFAAKMLSLPLWGRVAHRHGSRRLLIIGGIAVIPLSSLWLISQNPTYLFCVQLTAGVTWAAYELALFLVFFDHIKPTERTSVLTVYNLGNAATTALGSIGGGLILYLMQKQMAAYMWVFGLSSLVRLLTVPFLLRVPHPPEDGHQTPTTVVYGPESLNEPPAVYCTGHEQAA